MGWGNEGELPKIEGRIVADPAPGFRSLDFIYFPNLRCAGKGQSSG